ncbi:DUF4142 domain-containing protein [Burkholderia multivorans]|uniref:DUF305 domain-containing protein n=1 Tax=Burkholderia multivorans TaxID=87883 RepID=A0A2S9MSQ5_9BURK|nr:DUF4142 domain-containing protein [Burkholderia multivorans]MBU9144641.1 DUF4142 domain-containing protein [Burkholderia multivorans]MBU9511722.1 DUF4142 domain-containing protein [Burkholderia multivorans]MBU9523231.1 DUF4142 domain-containing protein [Burkholderia multivorans]MBU9634950.1 DUF4142 domain-containing protein [Burkholderia multivorans]PRF00741.1 DUF305 domain-containing protein [Burkholderia multivorans]
MTGAGAGRDTARRAAARRWARLRVRRRARYAACAVGLAAVGLLTAALAEAEASPASPASSAHVAPGVVSPAPTGDEADMARRPSGIDAEFVDKAAMLGKTELLASQLAAERSSNAEVKAFARRMIDDHERIARELRRLGVDKGVPVQTRMLVDPALNTLRTLSGPAFDRAYVQLAGPAAHEEAIRTYEAEARDGHDAQLRAFAARTLPMLKNHLAAARALATAVAGAR